MKRIIKAFFFSMAALRYGWKNEAALRQELILLLIAIPLAVVISPDAWKCLALIAVILLVLSAELLNTAIEKLADRVSPQKDPLIKIAKDCGSAAVLITLIIAGSVWCLALWEWLQ